MDRTILSLSRDGIDALCHILYVGRRDARHRDATVIREINVRVRANLEHLITRQHATSQAIERVRSQQIHYIHHISLGYQNDDQFRPDTGLKNQTASPHLYVVRARLYCTAAAWLTSGISQYHPPPCHAKGAILSRATVLIVLIVVVVVVVVWVEHFSVTRKLPK